MYILLSGKPPFDGNNDTEITNRVRKGTYTMTDQIWSSIGKDAKDLIQKMICVDVKKRVEARQAL